MLCCSMGGRGSHEEVGEQRQEYGALDQQLGAGDARLVAVLDEQDPDRLRQAGRFELLHMARYCPADTSRET